LPTSTSDFILSFTTLLNIGALISKYTLFYVLFQSSNRAYYDPQKQQRICVNSLSAFYAI
jgi:hypothetical protein